MDEAEDGDVTSRKLEGKYFLEFTNEGVLRNTFSRGILALENRGVLEEIRKWLSWPESGVFSTFSMPKYKLLAIMFLDRNRLHNNKTHHFPFNVLSSHEFPAVSLYLPEIFNNTIHTS